MNFNNKIIKIALLFSTYFTHYFILIESSIANSVVYYDKNTKITSECLLPTKIVNSDKLEDNQKLILTDILEDVNKNYKTNSRNCNSVISVQKFSGFTPLVCGRYPKFVVGLSYCYNKDCDTLTLFSSIFPNKNMILRIFQKMKSDVFDGVIKKEDCLNI